MSSVTLKKNSDCGDGYSLATMTQEDQVQSVIISEEEGAPHGYTYQITFLSPSESLITMNRSEVLDHFDYSEYKKTKAGQNNEAYCAKLKPEAEREDSIVANSERELDAALAAKHILKASNGVFVQGNLQADVFHPGALNAAVSAGYRLVYFNRPGSFLGQEWNFYVFGETRRPTIDTPLVSDQNINRLGVAIAPSNFIAIGRTGNIKVNYNLSILGWTTSSTMITADGKIISVPGQSLVKFDQVNWAAYVPRIDASIDTTGGFMIGAPLMVFGANYKMLGAELSVLYAYVNKPHNAPWNFGVQWLGLNFIISSREL